MSATAVAVMILVVGFVWGGFITLALKAVRSESDKTRARAALADTAAARPVENAGARGPAESAGVRRKDDSDGG